MTKDELSIFEELPKEWKNAIFRGTFALSIEAYSEAIAQFRWVRDQMNVDYFINGVPEKRLPSYLYLSSKIAELYNIKRIRKREQRMSYSMMLVFWRRKKVGI